MVHMKLLKRTMSIACSLQRIHWAESSYVVCSSKSGLGLVLQSQMIVAVSPWDPMQMALQFSHCTELLCTNVGAAVLSKEQLALITWPHATSGYISPSSAQLSWLPSKAALLLSLYKPDGVLDVEIHCQFECTSELLHESKLLFVCQWMSPWVLVPDNASGGVLPAQLHVSICTSARGTLPIGAQWQYGCPRGEVRGGGVG